MNPTPTAQQYIKCDHCSHYHSLNEVVTYVCQNHHLKEYRVSGNMIIGEIKNEEELK